MGAPSPTGQPVPPLAERFARALAALGAADAAGMAAGLAALLRPDEAPSLLLPLLAGQALADAPTDPARASLLLDAAGLIHDAPPQDGGLLAYARARLHLVSGRPAEAEAALASAAALWQQAGDEGGVARSLLGQTQLLAMRGRYAEAEEAATGAVERLARAAAQEGDDPQATILLAGALHNRATLYVMQERHAAALGDYDAGATLLELVAELGGDAGDEARLDLAHNQLNRAGALTYLDQPQQAEDALRAAIAGFEAAGEPVERGRALTNLGRLHVRLGAYAAALEDFAQAARDLFGQAGSGPVTTLATVDDELLLRRADELPLEQANCWLALNLLPEAEADLAVAERLFRSAEQPYELGQTLYTRGLVLLRRGEAQQAAAPLGEALALFAQLDNGYWQNRTRLALAAAREAALSRADADPAARQAQRDELSALLATGGQAGAAAWDALGQAEALLLRGRLALAAGELERAADDARAAATVGAGLPQITLRADALLGSSARRRGDLETARAYLLQAIERLEQGRSALPFEEVRTTWLDDKGEIYTELLLTLLDAPAQQPDLSAAFAAVERARSRALFERLLATAEVAGGAADETPQLEEVRRRLHWLYNQLLGESGSRALDGALAQALHETEAQLQSLSRQQAQQPLFATVEPVSLATFQAALAPDRQAVAYAVAGDELLAFVIDRDGAQLFRRLCSVQELAAACGELTYQLGRAALGQDYLARHGRRLIEALHGVLGRLHALVIAPLAPALRAERLLLLPAGPLHGLPFHALWDGSAYLVERFELAVATSASMETALLQRTLPAEPWAGLAWAGLALNDPTIPAARREVEEAARCFANARLCFDAAAGMEGLRLAAGADILHIATHGLFRADNPFFSLLKLADGWADVRTIYQLPLAARLVVLSACESGAGHVAAGEEVVGLARGFLGAGARSLVATLWQLHDENAVGLMGRFYAELTAERSLPVRPAAALRAAQRAAIAAGEHPWYWASFYVIGE